jgi:hypothetical protein
MLSALGMEYEKIDACKDNCMLFYKEHKNEMTCLKYGKLRFVEVINEDCVKVMTKFAHKHLRYMPLMPWMKWLFLSKKTARHMMVHPSDSVAWKDVDDFDANFARDVRNVCIGLVIDGFSPNNMSVASYSY